MSTRITLPHGVAIAVGVSCIAFQAAIVLESLGTVSETVKYGVILASVCAAILPFLAESAWRQNERMKGMLQVLPVFVLMAFVLPSGVSRLGEAQDARQQAAVASQGDAAKLRADLAKADKLVAEAQAWAATECRSGNGTKCQGVNFTLAQRTAYQRELASQVKALTPVATPWLPTWHPATLPIGLELAIWSSLFFGLGPLAKRSALTFERPITSEEIDELKKVLRITATDIKEMKAKGMKQHEIAAELGCNQGRISELMSGKRSEIVLH